MVDMAKTTGVGTGGYSSRSARVINDKDFCIII